MVVDTCRAFDPTIELPPIGRIPPCEDLEGFHKATVFAGTPRPETTEQLTCMFGGVGMALLFTIEIETRCLDSHVRGGSIGMAARHVRKRVILVHFHLKAGRVRPADPALSRQ